MAGMTIYVIDFDNKEHRLDNVMDIIIDRVNIVLNDGVYQDEHPIYQSEHGIAEAGSSTSGVTTTTTTKFIKTSADVPNDLLVPIISLPDSAMKLAKKTQTNPQSIIEFIIDGWTLGTGGTGTHVYPFAFANEVKMICTRSQFTYAANA